MKRTDVVRISPIWRHPAQCVARARVKTGSRETREGADAAAQARGREDLTQDRDPGEEEEAGDENVIVEVRLRGPDASLDMV